ncbi:hypothetical protein ACR77J_08170 [Tissierella praeacuta]|uniref:hypothetical protein n=1 Tax=Tissierella praeacuta TaxID=43131 RepID=UPI003DA24E08
MGWIIFIVIAFLILYFTTKNAGENLKSKIRTKEGYPKIDVVVTQCDNAPQGVEALISCNDKELIITANGFEKIILHEDIMDITLENAYNIINNANFSYSKAVAGTLLFGGIGAIAGLPSNKQQELKMLVISYIDKKIDDINYMVFLQKTSKERSVKSEAFVLNKVKDDLLDVIHGTYNIGKLDKIKN